MGEEFEQYHSYLLRFWTVKLNDHTVWRASLISSNTGEKWGFADLSELCSFLENQMVIWMEEDSVTGGERNN